MSNHLLNPTLAVTVLMNLKSQCISARISVLQIDICTVATLIYNILYCVGDSIAEKKAALSAVAEAQSRIQLSFGQQILQGKPCDKAVEEVSEISKLSDDGKSKFGDFSLGNCP